MESACVAELCGFPVERGAGIGDRDEAMAGLVGADRFRHPRVKIVFQRIGLGGAPGFAGNDEDGSCDVDRRFQRANLGGVGRIQHMQFRKTRRLRKSRRQHLRTETRSAHAENDRIGEFLLLHPLRVVLIVGRPIEFRGRACKPAQPFALVGAGPHRFVMLPKFAERAGGPPLFRLLLDGFRHGRTKRQRLVADSGAEDFCTLAGDRAEQLVGRIVE